MQLYGDLLFLISNEKIPYSKLLLTYGKKHFFHINKFKIRIYSDKSRQSESTKG